MVGLRRLFDTGAVDHRLSENMDLIEESWRSIAGGGDKMLGLEGFEAILIDQGLCPTSTEAIDLYHACGANVTGLSFESFLEVTKPYNPNPNPNPNPKPQ